MKTIGISVWVKFHDFRWEPKLGKQRPVFEYPDKRTTQTKWYLVWLCFAFDITVTTKERKL